MDQKEGLEIYKHLKEIFFQYGVTDDLMILESIAYFLLCIKKDLEEYQIYEQHSSDEAVYLLAKKLNVKVELIPSPPKFENILSQKQYLYQDIFKTLKDITNLSLFFNHTLIFTINALKAGGRYPTPRHITKFMQILAELSYKKSLADLACGSGGLLVGDAVVNTKKVFGVEISPNWARIAFTNLVLHDVANPEIRIGDSFRVVPTIFEKFDVILMNPPFGVKVNLFKESFDADYPFFTSQSELAFLQLGLESLNHNGHLLTLLPSGFLFSTNKNDLGYKEYLLSKGYLQYVIAFPDDAFQPYSSIRTHLLDFQKTEKSNTERLIWFYQARYDGFTPGRNRKQDPDHNDLPSIELAVKSLRNQENIWNAHYALKFFEYGATKIYSIKKPKHQELPISIKYGFDEKLQVLLVKENGEESEYVQVCYGENVFSGSALELKTIKLSQKDTHEINKNGFKFNSPGRKKVSIRSNGIQIEGRLIPFQSKGYLCFVIQPEKGYYSKPKFIDDLSWLKNENEDLEPPFVLPVRQDEEDSAEFPYYFLVWDSNTLNGYPLISKSEIQGYWRNLNSGQDVVLISNGMKDDFYFRFFDHDSYKTLPQELEGLVLDQEAKILGVGVNSAEIKKHQFDLQPATYFPEEQTKEDLRTPADLLSDIKKQYNQVNQNLDRLMQMVARQNLLSDKDNPPKYPLASLLEGQQKELWKLILNYFPSGKVFQLDTIKEQISQATSDLSDHDIENNLTLFEMMGLINRIQIEQADYYRLVINKDMGGNHEN